MAVSTPRYHAMVSSDWNECLAPCGPFDCLAFAYPRLAPELNAIFRRYTANRMSLGEATRRILQRLPAPLDEHQMDAYLDQAFATYAGVPDLIEWCAARGILFMINTTGFQGYFQRIFAKGLLPAVPLLSAHPMIRYPGRSTDPAHILTLMEVGDKGRNTASAARLFGIPAERIILMGDSGGDGPHFDWGRRSGARLIGCMTKFSLQAYCRDKHIAIDRHFGVSYERDMPADRPREQQFDFLALTSVLEDFLSV